MNYPVTEREAIIIGVGVTILVIVACLIQFSGWL